MFKIKLSFLYKVLLIATFLAIPLILASNAEAREICNRYDRGDRLCYDTNSNALKLFIGYVPRWAVGEGFMDISGMTLDPEIRFDTGDTISFDKSVDTFQFSEGGNTLLSLSDGTVDLSGMTNDPELCFADDSCITGGAITALPSTRTIMGEIQFLFNDLEGNKEPAIKFIKRYWDPDPNFKTTEIRLGDTDTTWSQINMYETPSDNELGFEQASFSYGIPGKTYLISTHDEERGTILVMRLSDGMVDLSGMTSSFKEIKFTEFGAMRYSDEFGGQGIEFERINEEEYLKFMFRTKDTGPPVNEFHFFQGNMVIATPGLGISIEPEPNFGSTFGVYRGQGGEIDQTQLYFAGSPGSEQGRLIYDDSEKNFRLLQGTSELLKVSDDGVVVPTNNSDPATCDEGAIYYNSTNKTFKGCTDTGWKQLEFTP